MKGLYFVEAQAEKLKWLTIQGRTVAEASIATRTTSRSGVNIDDDQSCYDARVRFGLVLNNEANISDAQRRGGLRRAGVLHGGLRPRAGGRHAVAHGVRVPGRRDLLQHGRAHLDPLGRWRAWMRAPARESARAAC
jgi:hypothetical protein